MSEYFFGLGPGHLDDAVVDPIVKKHGAYLVNYTEPRGEKRHWFACRNRGNPFDRQTASDVMDALAAVPGALDPVEEADEAED